MKFRRKGGLDRALLLQIALSLSEAAHGRLRPLTTNLQVGTKIDDADEWSEYVRRVGEASWIPPGAGQWKASTFTHPPRCTRYDHLRPGICPRCPSWGRIKSPISLWKWKREFDPAHRNRRPRGREFQMAAFDMTPGRRWPMSTACCALSRRAPGLARDCAHRLMALIAKCGWPEHVARNAGGAAGLDEVRAARWTRKHYEAHPVGTAAGSPKKTRRPAVR